MAKSENRSQKELRLKSLFLLALKEDQLAYTQFLEEITILLRAFLGKMMKYGQMGIDAEDIVQEVLISVHQKRDLFDQEKDLLPWLFAIARYRMIDLMRSQARKPRHTEYKDIVEDPKNLEKELSDFLGESDGKEMLEGLSDLQKDLIWLSKVDEVPLQEIAQRKNISHSLVKVTIHRTLKLLRNNNEKKNK
ncbi:MAG: sigma-70 family RNA polymerase sigma factor [Bacteriovoracaceae bacterium]